MKIAEIFYSVQGEGSLLGVPSVFIRTSGCNLRCTWCDTPYTSWTPEGDAMSIDGIMSAVSRHPARHVVITGGEPMMFVELSRLTARLRELGFHITIETAGTLFQDLECDLMSISPKLANSTPHDRDAGRWALRHEQLRYQPDILRRLMGAYQHQLKFVLASPGDIAEMNTMVAELAADPARVILMPEGIDAVTLSERGRWLAELAKQFGYRLSPRLHVDLWGAERGR